METVQMIQYKPKEVAKIMRVEWDRETDAVRLILEITDDAFKSHVLHTNTFEDILVINGRNSIVVASKE
jgi:hypothetical protein